MSMQLQPQVQAKIWSSPRQHLRRHQRVALPRRCRCMRATGSRTHTCSFHHVRVHHGGVHLVEGSGSIVPAQHFSPAQHHVAQESAHTQAAGERTPRRTAASQSSSTPILPVVGRAASVRQRAPVLCPSPNDHLLLVNKTGGAFVWFSSHWIPTPRAHRSLRACGGGRRWSDVAGLMSEIET